MKKKNIFLGIVLGGLLVMNNMAGAYSVRTPDGKMPLVHWAVLVSQPGRLPEMQVLAAGNMSRPMPEKKRVHMPFMAVRIKLTLM